MNRELILDIRGVGKRFSHRGGVVEAIQSVSFSVFAGERLAIMGPSGSGKSTLLHIAGGLEAPDRGGVLYRGDDIAPWSADKRAEWRNRHVGFVFQFHHLLGELSAIENVSLPLEVSGMRRKEAAARAESILTELGLSERLTHHPSALSGGERERVAVARALVARPEIVLADEPTGNLDHVQGERVLSALFAAQEKGGSALVLVTHNPDLARACDRTLFLYDGEIKPANG